MNNLEKKIGNTTLVHARNLMKELNIDSNIYLKVENTNLTGSIKDRITYRIIKDAYLKGIIKSDTIIIEATSGNTGISIACISEILHLKCIIVMPYNTSIKKINLIKQYHGDVLLVKGNMNDCIKKLDELKKKYKNHFILDQFNNKLAVKEHYENTALEIINTINEKIDIFICGIGTGATFTGCAKRLKEKNKDTICIGVLPKDNKNMIEGIGAGFIPSILDINLIDDIIYINNKDAMNYQYILSHTENLYCGLSSGAALCAGITVAKTNNNKNIVIILPDDANRYILDGDNNE